MRLFFGIPVSEEVRAFYLETLKPQLEAEFIGKFVETENLHITMLFLGEVEKVDFLNEVKENLKAITHFQVTVRGYGYFGRPPRVLFMDVTRGIDDLTVVHDAICRSMKIRDTRFAPHVTLARIKKSPRDIDAVLELMPHKEFSWLVPSVVLYESKLTSKGPIYTVFEEIRLKAL